MSLNAEASIVHGNISCSTITAGPWQVTASGHLLPTSNALFDIGSAEQKVRHLFLSDNSLTVGSQTISEENLKRNLRLTDSSVPSSNKDTGTKGEVVVGTNFVYTCVEDDTWVRLPLETQW